MHCDTTPWTHPFKCAVASCKNVFGKYDPTASIKYHNIPLNLELQQIWLKNCSLQQDFLIDTVKVCSVHFLPTDYDATGMLKTIAVPTQLLEDCPRKDEVQSIIDENLLLKEMQHRLADENKAFGQTLLSLEKQRLLKEKKLKMLKKQYDFFNKCGVSSSKEDKSLLSKVFSPSQINVLLHKKRVVWSDDDMAMAFTLRQMGSRDCYLYLKQSLNFPLPSLSSVQRWTASK